MDSIFSPRSPVEDERRRCVFANRAPHFYRFRVSTLLVRTCSTFSSISFPEWCVHAQLRMLELRAPNGHFSTQLGSSSSRLSAAGAPGTSAPFAN